MAISVFFIFVIYHGNMALCYFPIHFYSSLRDQLYLLYFGGGPPEIDLEKKSIYVLPCTHNHMNIHLLFSLPCPPTLIIKYDYFP